MEGSEDRRGKLFVADNIMFKDAGIGRVCRSRRQARDASEEPSAMNAVDQYWPALPLEEWEATYRTLHMWTQIVGKFCCA